MIIQYPTDFIRLERNTGQKTGGIRSLAYSPDGGELMAAGFDGFVRFWDSRTGEELRVLDAAGDPVRSAAYSPDGRFILTAGNRDRTARVWERLNGKEHLVLRGHGDVIESAVFSPEGTQILTASWDQTARLWDFPSGREVRAFKGHAHWLLSAAFSRSGDLAATGDRNGEVKVWSLAGSGESLLLGEHGATVLSACFSPDAKGMVTASWGDATVKIWNVDQRKETLNFTGHQNPVQRALFSSDGQKVLSASQDGEVFLWRADTGKIIHEFKCEAMRGDYGGLAFSHDGARLAVAPCADQSVLPIRVWNANDGALLATTPPTSGSCGLTFSPDGRYFATANWDWVARLWDAQTGEQLRMFKGHSNWVRSVAFSPDSRRLLTGSEDRTIRLWDVATGQELFSSGFSPCSWLD